MKGEAYELWREGHTVMRINIYAELLLNQKNYILKAKCITNVENDEIKENIRLKIWNDIRLKIWNDTEDHTKGMNGYKMDTNDKEHEKRDQESNNTGLGKIENNKYSGAGEQHTVRN